MRTNLFIQRKNTKNFKKEVNSAKSASIRNASVMQQSTKFTSHLQVPELLIITSYPPRECGIATYSQDLRNAMTAKFGDSFSIKICALESTLSDFEYPDEVKYILNTQNEDDFLSLAEKINLDDSISMIYLQHEFGLFGGNYGDYLLKFLVNNSKPVAITMHTVLPNPNDNLKDIVQKIAFYCEEIIVMTNNSAKILTENYAISKDKINVIAHGTHLVSPTSDDKKTLRSNFSDRIVLSTFGLISEGKSIETALEALPKIVSKFPNVLYLIIGKTHPEIIKKEGEKYRDFLYETVNRLHLQNNVKFINSYLSLNELKEYLSRTDIYLFTAKDPNQAVSGTLAYAMACGCPVISTPIPHAKELLDGAGLNFGFQNSNELAEAAIKLLYEPELRREMSSNALHKISPTSWQNSAIAHVNIAQKNSKNSNVPLQYKLPDINLKHIKRLTTEHGMIQFSNISSPDLTTGYTLDDNSRALVAMVTHYKIYNQKSDLELIKTYLHFIIFCQKYDGSFLNYVDKNGNFTENNSEENLEDSNGRAIWALGKFCINEALFDEDLRRKANYALQKSFETIKKLSSPRAISFVIKGLYHYNINKKNPNVTQIITTLADNLVSKYRGVSDEKWQWFENYLTYANSVIPEAMLCAAISTNSKLYEDIAIKTFDFLLSVTFKEDMIKVVSNKGWYKKGIEANVYGEQPIDVVYTVLALCTFYKYFEVKKKYFDKMESAFNWFLGKNHLNQIVYNPQTGGCFDGLEENHINLNQGAESTVSYLMSRLAFEELINLKNQN